MLRYGLVLMIVLAGYGLSVAAPGGSSPGEQRVGQNYAAEKHYKDGLRHRDAAWVYEEKMAGTKGEKERGSYARFIQQTYERAVVAFEKAIEQDAKFHQAYSSLGYVRRKTGDLPSALKAYDQALQLNPTYTEAIEYRAEAYFELGRIRDAQKAYQLLASLNKPHASRLLEFAEKWVDGHADAEVQARISKWGKVKREELGDVKQWIEKW